MVRAAAGAVSCSVWGDLMAYLLRKTAATNSSAVVSLGSLIQFIRSGGAGYTGNWSIKFKVQMTGTSLPLLSGLWTQAAGVNSDNIVFFTTTTNLQLRSGGNQRNITLPQPATNLYEYELVGSSALSNITVFQDGVNCGSVSGASLFNVDLGSMLAFGSNVRTGDLYWVEFYNNGVLQHRYVGPDTGTGLTLFDNVGSNNGSLVGTWPSDNSQWAFYESGVGTVTAALAATMPQFQAAANVSSSAPAVSASAAFTMPQLSASVVSQNAAPVYAATVSALMPQFTVAATASNTIPAGGASVSFQMPQFGATAAADNAAPVYSASAGITMPQFAVAVSAASATGGVAASIAYAMPQFSASVVAVSSAPVYAGTVSITMPQFGVSILSGEFAYFETPSARIEWQRESTRIELLAASRRIDYTGESTRIDWRA